MFNCCTGTSKPSTLYSQETDSCSLTQKIVMIIGVIGLVGVVLGALLQYPELIPHDLPQWGSWTVLGSGIGIAVISFLVVGILCKKEVSVEENRRRILAEVSAAPSLELRERDRSKPVVIIPHDILGTILKSLSEKEIFFSRLVCKAVYYAVYTLFDLKPLFDRLAPLQWLPQRLWGARLVEPLPVAHPWDFRCLPDAGQSQTLPDGAAEFLHKQWHTRITNRLIEEGPSICWRDAIGCWHISIVLLGEGEILETDSFAFLHCYQFPVEVDPNQSWYLLYNRVHQDGTRYQTYCAQFNEHYIQVEGDTLQFRTYFSLELPKRE